MWVTLWLTFAARPNRSIGDRALLVVISLIVPAGLLLHAWNVAGGGLPPSQIARVAFWPPEWWGMWWPRGLRRPSDLWKRLPWPARLVRSALSAFIVTLPALILTRQWVEVVTRAPVGWFGTTESALAIGAASIVVLAILWAYRQRLTAGETIRLLFGATTMSPGWDSPALRRILAPAHGAVRPPDSREPRDFVRAIDDVASRLDGSMRDVAIGAAAAARRLVEVVDQCDAELRAVSMAGNAGATDRLTEQIAALESSVHGNNEMGELLRLLRAQLAVVERVRVRCEVLSSRRAHLLQLVQGLWTRLSAMEGVAPEARPDALKRLAVMQLEIEAEITALSS